MEDDNRNTQIQVPAFTVLKKGSILKQIFLLRKQNPSSNHELDEEIILRVGRHPRCNITLEHPSISRYHLRIHSNPSSQTISVVDLSSVHGTWVSGKRIEPGVQVGLKEGDTVKLGSSSRVYELHWVPLRQAYDVDGQLMSAIYTIKEGEEEMNQNEKLESQSSDDEKLESQSQSSVQAPLDSEDRLNWLKDNLSNEFAQLSPADMKDDRVSVDLLYGIKTHEKDALNHYISDNPDHSNRLKDNLSIDFDQFSHETMKYDLVSVDLFNGIKSHEKDGIIRDISNSLNKSQDGSNWLRDNLSNECKQIGHGTTQDDPVSLNLFDAIKMHEKEALNQDMSRIDENEPLDQQEFIDSLPVAIFEPKTRDEDKSFMPDRSGDNEVYVVCESELMTLMKMMDESASVVLFEGEEEVDLGVKFESIDQEIMKEESVFVVLSNEADMNQEQTFTPDKSRDKEVHNLEAMKNTSVSMNLFDSLDGNELELFTPDKENKNPNARSGRSLKKTWKEDQNFCTMSTEAVSPTVNKEKDIFGFSKILSTSLDEVNPFVYCEEVLLSSSEGSSSSIVCPQTVEKVLHSNHGGEKKIWTMIVDTNTLLHEESLKHLKLLEGLKGTRVLVPKIAIRELMNIKNHDNFLKRQAKKAVLALKWIFECMANTKWWIQISEAESQVLETAIFLRKEATDGKIVILSNDLTLKIKAMAEGIMCEAAEEFRRSLVNPFSLRFMWVGSSAIGLTWSSVDDDSVRIQKYHGCFLNGSHELKGLKLLAYV